VLGADACASSVELQAIVATSVEIKVRHLILRMMFVGCSSDFQRSSAREAN
jgi:hypothetical protein